MWCAEKQSKKKGECEDALIGPWIQKLHVADNGIDATCSGDCDLRQDERASTLIRCLRMIGQYVVAFHCYIFLDRFGCRNGNDLSALFERLMTDTGSSLPVATF